MMINRLARTLLMMLCLAAPAAFGDDHAEDEGWVNLIPEAGEEGIAGWSVGNERGADHWALTDGVIVGENEDRAGSILWTEGEYTDFELIVEYRTPSQDYDSGIFLRGPSHQVQIGISRSLRRDMTACIYAPRDGQGGYPGQNDNVEDLHNIGEWNTMRMVVTGNRIRTFLNGEAVVDYEARTIPDQGRIGLQLHANVHMVMEFRVVRVREIEAE